MSLNDSIPYGTAASTRTATIVRAVIVCTFCCSLMSPWVMQLMRLHKWGSTAQPIMIAIYWTISILVWKACQDFLLWQTALRKGGAWGYRRRGNDREGTSCSVANILVSMTNIQMRCRDHVCKASCLCQAGYDLTTFHTGLVVCSNKERLNANRNFVNVPPIKCWERGGGGGKM